MENELKLTSVKVLKNLNAKFKQNIIDTDFTLQKLVNRSIYLYINDIDFRTKLTNIDSLIDINKNL